jgi:serine/threonine protein kinase
MSGTGRTGPQGFDTQTQRPAGAAESVPGYRELARIGHGGFSVVYRAVQESFERSVALKVLTVGSDEDARRRFLREVRLASKLSGHPHVVTVLDTGSTASGRPYLAMDLYDGGSMKQWLVRRGPLSAAETALLGAKIADALAAAHSLGVIHRDVKPNNILVSRFGEPALADFGVSVLLDSSHSASVLDVFSPQHAAPELMARGTPTKSSDLYALGSTLYELLTGRPPFDSENRDVRSLMWRVMSEPAPRPDCPELPGLADAIVKALAKDPADRFPDAADFARTLRALIPDGTSATLLLPDFPYATGATASASATPVQPPPVAPVFEDDDAEDDYGSADTSAGYGYPPIPDETMVRPEREGEAAAAPPPGRRRGGAGAQDGGRDGRDASRKARKPLLVGGVVLLIGATGWALIASQSPSGAARAASTPSATLSVSAKASAASTSAKPSHSASASVTRSATHAATATAAAEVHTSAAPSASSATTGSLLTLPGTYNRFLNAQSGRCLESAAGSSTGQAACGSSHSQGWEYSEPLSGILTGPVSGEFELVNERSGDCLTASGGSVAAESCNGGPAQMWSKSGSGSSTELKNSGSAQCLRANGSGVSAGTCSSSDQADLWSEDGSV